MMLKPFHIRDLRVAHPEPASHPNPALIRISTTDYDDIASNHPRARLTYVDEDDDGDETITVGSALELSQRLEEPLDIHTRVDSLQLQGDATPRHTFDVRRTNSVTELWKRFEDNQNDKEDAGDHVRDEPGASEPGALEDRREASPLRNPTVSNEPRPLMEAFEAELAEMLHAAESSEKKLPKSDTPPIAEPFSNSRSERTPHPVEIIAAQVMDQLTNGANMVQNEWRSRMPELQRQLQNAHRQLEAAHRTLPRNVETSLRALLATLEAHMRTAFNNLPDGSRQMAEDAFQAGRPVAENAADGLRMMASEFNEVGRTLFSAFESEFGRAGPAAPSSNEPPTAGPAHPQAPVYPSDEKPMPVPGESKPEGAVPSRNPLYTAPEAPHFPPHPPHHAPTPTNNLPPAPFPTPMWNPFQTFNQPPPPYPSHPPTQQPIAWPQPRATPWPHWRSAPTPTAYNGAQPKSRQVPVAKSAKPKVVGPGTKSLFIGNVGFKVTEKMIQDVFASKGFIVDVDLPTDASSESHAGFGYVHFPSEHPASAAMGALQGAVIDGHSINLEHMDHSPIGEVHRVQAKPGYMNTEASSAQLPRAELSDGNSVVDSSNIQTETSALLDAPSDDPAFSARFPSLLPGTGAQHPSPLDINGVSLGSRPGAEISRFPPVSQSDALLLANNSARMRDLGSAKPDTATEDTMTQLQKEEQSGSLQQQLPDDSPAEGTRHAMQSVEGEASPLTPENADIEECVSALVDMGYGTEQEGGRSRMAVYAAAAGGSLLDAIDMIEEERRAYECQAYQ
ncbi:unnamed protein product [Penicillium olsonii]|nr:unnamed protein product [Penicillium olsonii]